MRSIVLCLCLFCFAPSVVDAAKYRHKSEAEIAQMTPTQRVDEWVNEYVHHRFDISDAQHELLRKVVMRDGTKTLPRIIEIIDEYDPTRFREGKGRRGERFDACWWMLGYIDINTVRLRGSEEGRRAMNALKRAIGRMKAAGFGQPEQDKWEQHGRFDLATMELKNAEGLNTTDKALKETFRLQYKVILPNAELAELSNFLVESSPDYPSWSEQNYFQDYTQINEAGNPLWIRTMKKPERYYEVYLKFKEIK